MFMRGTKTRTERIRVDGGGALAARLPQIVLSSARRSLSDFLEDGSDTSDTDSSKDWDGESQPSDKHHNNQDVNEEIKFLQVDEPTIEIVSPNKEEVEKDLLQQNMHAMCAGISSCETADHSSLFYTREVALVSSLNSNDQTGQMAQQAIEPTTSSAPSGIPAKSQLSTRKKHNSDRYKSMHSLIPKSFPHR
ncbi:hypothetical protein DAPPUDRAFT_321547 [Daphnia pulex]|uniref:Uncharacterized protein n=1 Tax=Daphnia pulex TaxID=6669 RepID=E9GSZ5_DAPPU|nr:hypothetical protein DAPPUDRAFT_321547 [Daphnia pulex]|eukprot:EFX77278.1 hypothetical protein DAPPUDRAFT_321547 [Daphnia pulex]